MKTTSMRVSRHSQLHPKMFSIAYKILILTSIVACCGADSLNDEVDRDTNYRWCSFDIRPHGRVVTYCQNMGRSVIPHISSRTTVLDLHMNNFPEINKRLLLHADSLTLEKLDLSDVHGKTISPDVFVGSHMGSRLKTLNLANNEIVSLAMITRALLPAKHLTYLDVRNATREPYSVEDSLEMIATLQHVQVICDFDDLTTRDGNTTSTTETLIKEETGVTVEPSVDDITTWAKAGELMTTQRDHPTPIAATTSKDTTRDGSVLAVILLPSLLLFLVLVGISVYLVHLYRVFTHRHNSHQLLIPV